MEKLLSLDSPREPRTFVVNDEAVEPELKEAATTKYNHLPSEKDKTVSFSLDQVNDNPDELIALRGEGRYFGVTDVASGPICSNCHRRGHMRSKCKVVVCHACGLVDDHYETQCPKSMVCTNCGKKGHYKGQCEERMRRTFCTRCESKNHSDDRCPSIWRSYLTKQDRKLATKLPTIFCYNCGRENHYGDECNQYRSSKTPNIDGSGFSGNNLPKELRDLYFKRRNNGKKREFDNNNNNGGNYNDENSYDSNFYDEETLNVKRRKIDAHSSRSGYLNQKNNNDSKGKNKNKNNSNINNNNNNTKSKKQTLKQTAKQQPKNNSNSINYPRASHSGKLPSGNFKSSNNNNNNHNNNSNNSGPKRGFLPMKSEKKAYHKRF